MKGLGRGLASLMGETQNNSFKSEEDSSIANFVSIDKIVANNLQPRKDFDPELLQELALSIKNDGLLSPILVTKIEADKYEIIAGERRWRAAKLAGLSEIPVIIKNLDQKNSYRLAIIENIQRKDLNPIEEARAYNNLISMHNFTQNELSEVVGKSRSYIANSLRLLSLSDNIQNKISDGKISAGHAKILVSLENAEVYSEKIIEENLSVRNLEDLVKKSKGKNPKAPTANNHSNLAKDNDLLLLEKKLSESLGAKVEIESLLDSSSGKVVINFDDFVMLDRIIKIIYSAANN